MLVRTVGIRENECLVNVAQGAHVEGHEPATALKLCELEKEHCGFTGSRLPDTCTCPEHDCPCHALSFKEVHGRVPLFDPKLVRVTCGKRAYPKRIHPNAQCPKCFGRGYTPSTNPWAYVRAAWPLLVSKQWFILQAIERALNNISVMGVPDPQDQSPAAFKAVAKALLKEEAW